MQQELLEYVDNATSSLQVDVVRGVIRNVKLLGLQSRNGNRYLASALQSALPLYEGVKVHVNHPPRGAEALPRDYRDRIGSIQGVKYQEDGLYADFHFNPKHPLAAQLIWDAEHSPENVGFSHHAKGKGRQERGEFLVEEILHVKSVDLVTDPATTQGLFEACTSRETSNETSKDEVTWEGITVEQLKNNRPDLVTSLLEQSTARIQELEEQLVQSQTSLSRFHKREQCIAQCREANLAEAAITDVFLETLLEANSAADVAALIEDRVTLTNASSSAPANRPISKASSLFGDSKTFVESSQDFATRLKQ